MGPVRGGRCPSRRAALRRRPPSPRCSSEQPARGTGTGCIEPRRKGPAPGTGGPHPRLDEPTAVPCDRDDRGFRHDIQSAKLTNFLASGRGSARCEKAYSLKPLRQRAASGSATLSASAKRSFGPCGQNIRKHLRFFRIFHLCGNISDASTLKQRRLDAQTRKVRRISRVTSHLEKLAEFFEYATNVGETCGPVPLQRGFDRLKVKHERALLVSSTPSGPVRVNVQMYYFVGRVGARRPRSCALARSVYRERMRAARAAGHSFASSTSRKSSRTIAK